MHEIRIPRLGWSMDEGTFVGWLKRPGDAVAVGEPLFELESEKAVQAIEAIDAGILHVPKDAPQAGSTVEVGALLGYLLAPGEPIPSVKPTVAPAPIPAAVAAIARRKERTAEPDAPLATPRAKRVAAEHAIDWRALKGTGRGGRIREADVLRAATTDSGSMSPRRKAIAERLHTSQGRTIPVTLTTTADASQLLSVRAQYKSKQAPLIPAYTDVVACLVAQVLLRHPLLAVRWGHESRSLVPVAASDVHIGIAVDTPDGLLVPVIRHIVGRSLLDVAEESKSLAERARSGGLTSAEMTGGAFTISSLGAFGIEAFTPVINYPEVSILGLGAIRREPVVLADGNLAAGFRMTLSLTFDHAAVDGAPAAAFLRDIAAAIENCFNPLVNS